MSCIVYSIKKQVKSAIDGKKTYKYESIYSHAKVKKNRYWFRVLGQNEQAWPKTLIFILACMDKRNLGEFWE